MPQSSSMIDPWKIHTLVLDVDDTLFPERDFVLGGFAAAGKWLRAQLGVDGFSATATRLFEAGLRGRIFDESLDAMDVPISPELVGELVVAYRSHQPTLTLFPDAARLLSRAVGRVNVALLTDGFEAVQRNKIEALALDPRIELRVITDALGGRNFWKPCPEGFRLVMRRYPGESGGYVYVGDNPRKDFLGPRALGWRTVRIKREGGEHSTYVANPDEEADIVVTDLTELSQHFGWEENGR
ncbi:MAG: HAD family hydrolase [Opitutus sp.]|nr:HAD family hydrolase [Opitutus sp.]